MPYIPKFNPISLQEMAYAPALMRQQHDQAISNNMELADQLKFDYLKQDAPAIEPVLQGYSKDIEGISSDLAKFGFNNDVRNRIVGARSKFIADDKLDKYKKNYKTAMTGWEDTKKGLQQQKASGRDIENMRNAYFNKYKGAYDNEGMYQEFTPGATSGVYDVTEDARKAFTGIGSTGRIVGSTGTVVEQKNGVDRNGNNMTYFSVTDSKTGQRLDNLTQREAVAQYLKREYGDEQTDRGLYAKISGLTPDYINNAVDQVSNSMSESKYAQLPQVDTNISGINVDPARTGTQSKIAPYDPSQYQDIKGAAGSQEKGDAKVAMVAQGIGSDGNFDPNNIKNDEVSGFKREITQAWGNTGQPLIQGAVDVGKELLGQKPSHETKPWDKRKIEEAQNKTREETKALWTGTIATYKPVYDYFKNNMITDPSTGQKRKGTDADFLNFVASTEKNATVKKTIKYGLDDKDAVDMLFNKMYERGGESALIPVNADGTESSRRVSLASVQGTGKDKFIPTGQVVMDKYGDMTFNANGKEYKVNKSVLPEQMKVDPKEIDVMTTALTSYRLTRNQMNALKDKRWNIGGYNVKVNIDPNDPIRERKLIVEVPNNELGIMENMEFGDPASVQKYIAQQMYKRLSYEPFKKEK